MAGEQVRALVFDVFGTVVDWRSSVLREVEAAAARHGVTGDWGAFVDAWRYEGYLGGIAKVNRGEWPFMTTDEIHRRKLEELLPAYGLGHLPEAERADLNRAWHRLDPWPDSVPGLWRLKQRFVISTLSNGNVALLVAMAKRAGLPWDCVLGADVLGAFKPKPEAYRRGAELLGFAPGEVMLVAAHKQDLQAAMAAGLQAAFVPRPREAGPNVQPDLEPDPAFAVTARDFLELAAKLGA
ncbi:haloacid dehalogenase type II [Tepidiforma sp.]|uniref:haloacid dehalogenase type II n=1 Tax=Tepidiforma sp. TaxID=2682230 RepID=UPI002ADDF4AF|nr:haloacid dehalogenase type II [Tepidiforma sp.]